MNASINSDRPERLLSTVTPHLPDSSLLVRILTYLGLGRRATRTRKSFVSSLYNLFWGFSQVTIITVFLVLIGNTFKSPLDPSISEWSACDRPLGIWACLWIIRVALSSSLAYWEYRRDRMLSHSDSENVTSRTRQSQPANGNNTSPASPAPQQGAAARRSDPESLPYNHIYSRLTLLSSLFTLTWFLTANILQYTSMNTCRLAAPRLWWLLFGILSIMYLMVLEVMVLGFVVLVVAPILFVFWNIFLIFLGRHPMQNPGVIKHEIGKLSKAAVDKIPLVVYIPMPPYDSDRKADMHQMPQKEASNDDAKDNMEGQSDPWADKLEETEYPFVTLEGNHAACAVCLVGYDPKRKSGADSEDETDHIKAHTDVGEGTSGASAAEPVAREAETSELKLSDAGQGLQPLRLLDCGHVFHKTCIDPWLTDVSGRCPVCQRPVDPTKPHPGCGFPSCRNTHSFLRCNSCHSVWYCSLPHAQIDSSRHREECYAAILEPKLQIAYQVLCCLTNLLISERLLTALESETPLKRCARNLLFDFVGYCAFQRSFFNRYARKPQMASQIEDGNSRFDSEWKPTVDDMVVLWDQVRRGGALSLPLPIALLQLSVVMGNAMLRTMAILAFLLAVSSMAAASFLIAHKERMYSASMGNRWTCASKNPKYLSSIDFWTRLSWPITSFVWSMSLSLIVVILLAVVRQPDSSTVDTKNSDVAYVIVIFLGFMLICVLSYRVFKFCTR